MRTPHGHLPPPLRIPWLAVLTTVVLQQALAFVWYAGLFGGIWVAAQDFTFDYQSAHEAAILPPLVMAIGNAAGAILLAIILQRLHWPVALGPRAAACSGAFCSGFASRCRSRRRATCLRCAIRSCC